MMFIKSQPFGAIWKWLFMMATKSKKKLVLAMSFFLVNRSGKLGGGALMDFGCYGANLSTWLMKGKRPLSVVAVPSE
ncbi:MAG: hypothetical protein U5K54_21890 [Cytophagales bacterium]|nr:hypothetical protein [Cytophagales bacterium]